MSDMQIIGIINNFCDEELRTNYSVLKAILDLDNVTDSIFIEEIDRIQYPLMEAICDRFLKYVPAEVCEFHVVKN